MRSSRRRWSPVSFVRPGSPGCRLNGPRDGGCEPAQPACARGRRRPASRRRLLVAGFVVLFAYLPHWIVGDDYTRFDDIERLLHRGELSDSRYSLVMPLVSAPLLLIGEVVRSPAWWASRFNVVVVAAGALIALPAPARPGRSRFAAQLLLVLLFASLLTNRLRDYNAEVFTGTLFALGLI